MLSVKIQKCDFLIKLLSILLSKGNEQMFTYVNVVLWMKVNL